MNELRSLLCAGGFLILAGGTSSVPQATAAVPDTRSVAVELTVVGGAQLNPNAQGRPSPVVVRIFELRGVGKFDAADYAALFAHAGEALKAEVLKQEEFIVRPGDIQKHDREVSPQVSALGIAAAFRDLEHGVWHVSVPLRTDRRNFVLIDLDRNVVRLMPVDSGS